MTLDEIIRDLQKLRDEQFELYGKMPRPTEASWAVLAQVYGLTDAIAKIIDLRNKERQEQKQ